MSKQKQFVDMNISTGSDPVQGRPGSVRHWNINLRTGMGSMWVTFKGKLIAGQEVTNVFAGQILDEDWRDNEFDKILPR